MIILHHNANVHLPLDNSILLTTKPAVFIKPDWLLSNGLYPFVYKKLSLEAYLTVLPLDGKSCHCKDALRMIIQGKEHSFDIPLLCSLLKKIFEVTSFCGITLRESFLLSKTESLSHLKFG